LMDPHWHEGVVGLVASRIKDKIHRPVIAFANSNISGATSAEAIHRNGTVIEQKSMELKGSARSIPGLHIRDVLDTIAATNPGLINRFGGHAMAAGLSLLANKFTRFSEAFDSEVRRRLTIDKLQSEILTDGELEDEEFTLAMARQLRDGGPWGQGFPEPSFTGVFNLVACRIIADKHFKFSLSTLPNRNVLIDAIAFGDAENYAVEHLPSQLKIVYKLAVNDFRGRESMQLIIDRIVLPKGNNGDYDDKRVLDEE
jgi:single-stranded-DNA-specific exonuclease